MAKIAVVGAGIAGLVCAKHLTNFGHDVTVVEKDSMVGGRMSTTTKDGLAFDRGATFLVGSYENLHEEAKSLGIDDSWKMMQKSDGGFFFFKDGRLCPFNFESLSDIVRWDELSFWEKTALKAKLLKLKFEFRHANFFDLSTLPDKYDGMTAYDFADQNFGRKVASYVCDGFTSTYQFHGAGEISLSAAIALAALMANNPDGFSRYHTFPGQMSAIPEAIAKMLGEKLFLGMEVGCKFIDKDHGFHLFPKDSSGIPWDRRLESPFGQYDCVVLACPANVVRNVCDDVSNSQKQFLNSVAYAPTINVSFKIPARLLDGVYCVTVPLVESQAICEYTNESVKGVVDESGNFTLLNVGLHERFAATIMSCDDEEIFRRVKAELKKVCPILATIDDTVLSHHDLKRWPQAMPKFYPGFVSRVKSFWEKGQGENNLFFCGDHLGHPWTEGAALCGKKVAFLVNSKFSK